MYFTAYPEPWIEGVTREGKPSHDSPDKIVGSSFYGQVYQKLDTVIALYDIPPGTRFPHINGFSPRTSSMSPRASLAGSLPKVAAPISPTDHWPVIVGLHISTTAAAGPRRNCPLADSSSPART